MTKPFEFTPEDFAKLPYGPGYGVQRDAADIANAKLRELLGQAMETEIDGHSLGLDESEWRKRFTGRIVDIREIEGGEK